MPGTYPILQDAHPTCHRVKLVCRTFDFRIHLINTHIDNSAVLSKALINAAKELGLTQQDAGQVIGKDRTALARGIDPTSKAGELALMLIRCYRSLSAQVGGDRAELRHWMHTDNQHIGGVPAEQVKRIQGLTRVVAYLDAMQ